MLDNNISSVDSKLNFWGNGTDTSTSTTTLISGGYTDGVEFVSKAPAGMTNWIRFYNDFLQYQHMENGSWTPKWIINFANTCDSVTFNTWDTGMQIDISSISGGYLYYILWNTTTNKIRFTKVVNGQAVTTKEL